jgi:hypothetical protein
VRRAYAALLAARDALERHRERVRVRTAAARHGLVPEVSTLEETASRLSDDEVLVCFAQGVGSVHALVVT